MPIDIEKSNIGVIIVDKNGGTLELEPNVFIKFEKK
tara:strand:+ start:563 stop:670 length:108 start_codon:yes stop_codon:yes gene_type:complete